MENSMVISLNNYAKVIGKTRPTIYKHIEKYAALGTMPEKHIFNAITDNPNDYSPRTWLDEVGMNALNAYFNVNTETEESLKLFLIPKSKLQKKENVTLKIKNKADPVVKKENSNVVTVLDKNDSNAVTREQYVAEYLRLQDMWLDECNRTNKSNRDKEEAEANVKKLNEEILQLKTQNCHMEFEILNLKSRMEALQNRNLWRRIINDSCITEE